MQQICDDQLDLLTNEVHRLNVMVNMQPFPKTLVPFSHTAFDLYLIPRMKQACGVTRLAVFRKNTKDIKWYYLEQREVGRVFGSRVLKFKTSHNSTITKSSMFTSIMDSIDDDLHYWEILSEMNHRIKMINSAREESDWKRTIVRNKRIKAQKAMKVPSVMIFPRAVLIGKSKVKNKVRLIIFPNIFNLETNTLSGVGDILQSKLNVLLEQRERALSNRPLLISGNDELQMRDTYFENDKYKMDRMAAEILGNHWKNVALNRKGSDDDLGDIVPICSIQFGLLNSSDFEECDLVKIGTCVLCKSAIFNDQHRDFCAICDKKWHYICNEKMQVQYNGDKISHCGECIDKCAKIVGTNDFKFDHVQYMIWNETR